MERDREVACHTIFPPFRMSSQYELAPQLWLLAKP